MNPMVMVLILAGVLVALGVVGLLAAFKRRRLPSVRRPRKARQRSQHTPILVVAGLVSGLLTLLFTRWPVAAVGIGLGVWFVPQVIGGGKQSQEVVARAEAVASWTRRLADLLASGAAGSLDMALRRSAFSAPAAIAGPVATLVAGMDSVGTEPALRRFAVQVDDPSAERVAAALILRSRHGGRGLPEVLAGVATDLDERVRMVREIEAERAKPRSNARIIVLLTFALIVVMLLFSRDFLQPYSSAIGQICMVLVVFVFGAALRWIRKLSQPVVPPRFLVDPVGYSAAQPTRAPAGEAA